MTEKCRLDISITGIHDWVMHLFSPVFEAQGSIKIQYSEKCYRIELVNRDTPPNNPFMRIML